MTPKTQTKTDPATEVSAIQEQLEVARAERQRLGNEAIAWVEETAQFTRDLDGLAQNDPDQFANGFAKPKSKAAELQREIDKRTNGNRWSQVLEGADERIRELEHELHRASHRAR
jgi:hypothetical protein